GSGPGGGWFHSCSEQLLPPTVWRQGGHFVFLLSLLLKIQNLPCVAPGEATGQTPGKREIPGVFLVPDPVPPEADPSLCARALVVIVSRASRVSEQPVEISRSGAGKPGVRTSSSHSIKPERPASHCPQFPPYIPQNAHSSTNPSQPTHSRLSMCEIERFLIRKPPQLSTHARQRFPSTPSFI
uniref:Uncharacterized protein n=1 Tax=Takifugu rubripes TaxID=31033 RepID=A0A674NTX7_TAKRU